MDITRQQTSAATPNASKQYSYSDIVDYLDARWKIPTDTTLERMRQLDRALQSPSRKVPAIFFAGTNGKSLTAHFAAKLLMHEGLKVATFTAPHILLYKERFAINLATMPSRTFTEVCAEVITVAEKEGLRCSAAELLTAVAFQYSALQGADVVLLEVSSEFGAGDPVMIAEANVATITRVTSKKAQVDEATLHELARQMVTLVRPGMHLVSGDQNKAILHILHEATIARGGVWEMPIRKLAALSYPCEQLHGRCAALAERVVQLFLEANVSLGMPAREDSLLVRASNKRGRPSLEAKRQQELNPKKTIAQFWKETVAELPGKFQLLDKEKPTILLDTAGNVDAFEQVLLGIRLLHYQRPLKGLAIIVGATQGSLHGEEFLRVVRYFFKKTSGNILICPIEEPLVSAQETVSWDVEQVAADIKSMKVKARACESFAEAFDAAKKMVDDRNGLVVVTGSSAIVAAYWKLKGIKKF